jgi:catechol 2,3-dioxygenase
MANSIHPETTLGLVHLTVSDFNRVLPFYRQVLGFKEHRRHDGTVYLGGGGLDVLALTENPEARRMRGTTGLYHFAVLVPSRLQLAHSLKRIAETETPVQGFADHLVSEAIYLADPEGNGIEIYRDRPRSDWYDAQGNFLMGTEPLDLRDLLAELHDQPEAWNGLDPATRLGHMHLHVANIRAAEKFYVDVLGFGEMANLGTAGFVSAGGYHHHIGFNTWGTAGAPPPPPDALGLRNFIVQLPNQDELGKVLDRVTRAGLRVEETDEGLLVRDPSQNGVVLK